MKKKSLKTQSRIHLPTPIPEKKFLGNIGPAVKNFPADNRGKKREAKILPSHRAIFQNYRDNGYRHLGKAIRKTGVYSENIARRVDQITKSKSWQALMDEQMPEELMAKRHAEILNKRDYRKVENADGTTTEIDDGPNTAAVTKGLEMGYRLRGAFREREAAPPSTVMYNLFYKPEVREQMKNFEEGIKLSLKNEVARKNQKDVEEEAENRAIRDAEVE